MKALIIALAATLSTAARAAILPPNYYRFLGYDVQNHILLNFHPNVGAAVDPINPGETDGVTLVPLIMHSHADGYLFIPGEDYSPLAVGGGMNGGRLSLYVGPMFNVIPAVSNGLGFALDHLSDKYANLKSILSGVPASSKDAGVSLSPLFKPPLSKKERGSFRIFTGAWLKF